MVGKLYEVEKHQRGRELRQSLVLLALTGSSVGGLLGMVAIATRALGR